jgi:multiple sugar transport system permease protein
MTSNGKFVGLIGQKFYKLLRFCLLIGMSFVLLYPIIYMLSVAFRAPDDMLDPSVIWIPRSVILTNFIQAFRGMSYMKSLFYSITIGGVSSLLQIVSCAFIAYGFARFKFRERNFMFALVILTIIVPPQVTVLPLFLMFKNFSIPFIGVLLKTVFHINLSVNLIDNPLQFYLQAATGLGIRSGLYIFLLRQFFKGLPLELEEASEIDGCSPMGTFLKVIIPNAGSMLLTVFLFSFVWYWNDYFNTSIFLSNNQTLAIALTQLRVQLAAENGVVVNIYESITQMQAGCLIFLFPILLIYLFAQRYFTESIERSGLVG